MKALDDWIERLAEASVPNTQNPWRDRWEDDVEDSAPQQRRERLRKHLQIEAPSVICVGEAPGFRGARISGTAFTSERLLFDGAIPRLSEWQGVRLTTRERPLTEPSATIVWRTAYELGIADGLVLWNAFPFHPYGSTPYSNRTPSSKELRAHPEILQALLDLWPGARVVAVGRKAQGALRDLGIKGAAAARHPSMGGAEAFREGLRAVVEGTKR